MDKWEALYDFWSSFGIPAYDELKAQKTEYPYITYEAATSSFDNIVAISASIWDRSTSFETVDKKADEIKQYIESMGCPEIYGGRYRVFIGNSTYSRHANDPDDDQIVRSILSVNFEFMTNK